MPEKRTADRLARFIEPAAALVVILVVVLTLQWRDGAYGNELGGHPDEAAHYVTGRMMTDYLTTSLGHDPRAFAEEYYARYPKVAIGHWPPMFYIIMSGWFVLFGATYRSALVFMAVITAALAFTVGRMVRNYQGPLVALFASLLSLVLPYVHATTACLMADPLVALFSTWAILSYAWYLRGPNLQRAAAFGLLASAAILTKGNGSALAVMVPLAVIWGGRWALLGRWSFWLPAVIVAVVCAPWYWATRQMATGGMWSLGPSPWSVVYALSAPVVEGVRAVGPLPAALAAVGLGLTLTRYHNDELRQLLLCYLPGFVLVHAFTLPGELERRFLILVLPALLVFLVDGMSWLVLKAGGTAARRYASVAVSGLLVACGAYALASAHFPAKSCRGCADVVRFLMSRPELCGKPMLICSDTSGEGMFIAETLLQDATRHCLVLRGSKLFASSRWNGGEYVAFVHSPQDVTELLKQFHVGAIVIDASVPKRLSQAHDDLLAQALQSPASGYSLVKASALTRAGRCLEEGLRVYAANPMAGDPPSGGELQIDMRHNLDRPIKVRLGANGVEVLHPDANGASEQRRP